MRTPTFAWRAFAASCAASCGFALWAAPARAETYASPFAYCAAVGTVDVPDARYTGPSMPEAIARGLQKAFGVAPNEPLEAFERGTSWRCMDGAVYACNVGANLPCQEKPASDPQPTDAMRTYCKDNPESATIPMYVTGHGTIYDWICDDAAPKRGKRFADLDARGYVSSIWYRIAPPAGG